MLCSASSRTGDSTASFEHSFEWSNFSIIVQKTVQTNNWAIQIKMDLFVIFCSYILEVDTFAEANLKTFSIFGFKFDLTAVSTVKGNGIFGSFGKEQCTM